MSQVERADRVAGGKPAAEAKEEEAEMAEVTEEPVEEEADKETGRAMDKRLDFLARMYAANKEKRTKEKEGG